MTPSFIWFTTVVFCSMGQCEVIEVTPHAGRLACTAAASSARTSAPTVRPGEILIRDCARGTFGELLPTKKPKLVAEGDQR